MPIFIECNFDDLIRISKRTNAALCFDSTMWRASFSRFFVYFIS